MTLANLVNRAFATLLLLPACGGPAARGPSVDPASPAPDIRIDCADRLQRLDGFGSGAFGGFTLFERGGCDAEIPKGVTYRTTPDQRRLLVETAVRELGVTHLRVWLCPAGVERENDNNDPRVMAWDRFTWEGLSREPTADSERANRMNGLAEWGEILRPAVAAGLETWIVTAGWLPDWLEKRIKDPGDADRFEEYAEWAAAHLLYLKRTFGLEAPFWSLMNEPDNLELVDPAFWKAWIRATGERFRREGLRTRIMFPDYMNVYRALPLVREVLRDESVRPFIGALAYHHYRSCGDDPKPFLDIASDRGRADRGPEYEKLVGGARAMAEIGRHYHLPSWQTETAYYPGPIKGKGLGPWQVGRGRANEIHHELAAGASAVEGMLMIWVDGVDPRVDFTGRYNGNHIVMHTDGRDMTRWEVTKDCGAVFAHYARFTRPGDRVVRATSADPLLRATAFSCAGRRRCVVVVVNNDRAGREVRIRLEGLGWAPRAAGAVVTDETRAFEPLEARSAGNAGPDWQAVLPPLSLATFVWDAESVGRMPLPEGVNVR